jgi:hypothetical protein
MKVKVARQHVGIVPPPGAVLVSLGGRVSVNVFPSAGWPRASRRGHEASLAAIRQVMARAAPVATGTPRARGAIRPPG